MNEDLNKTKSIALEILLQIQAGKSFSDVMSRLGEPEYDKAVEYCVSYGYVNGLHPMRVASGRLTVDGEHNKFGISSAGLEFIDSYNRQNHH